MHVIVYIHASLLNI